MKVIVAGGRNILDPDLVAEAIQASGFEVTELVSGCARGVDQYGEHWAAEREIPIKRFPADWDQYGRSAGPRRNAMMAAYGEALVAVWDGMSPGTKNMIDQATIAGLKVYVHPAPMKDSARG